MNKIMKILSTFLLLFLIPQLAYSQKLSDEEVYDLLKNGILLNVDYDESQIKAELGEPDKITSGNVSSPYYAEKDLIRNFFYSGLEISFYECKNTSDAWKKIVSIQVSSDKYKLKFGLKVGMPIAQVDQFFQGCERQSWDSSGINYISFSMPDSVHDQINFAFVNGIVKKIEWSNRP